VRRPPQDLDAWDCFQRGHWRLLQYTKDDNIEAQSWARRAIELQPDSSAPFTILAFSHVLEVIYQWSESPARSREEAVRAAEKGVALDQRDSNAHFALGFASSLAGQYERAMAVLQRAIELNPSSAVAHWALGAALTPCGCPDSGIPLIEKAIRLSPHDPWMHEFLFNIAAAHFAAERYDDAVTFAKRSLQSRSEQPGAYRLLAASYGHLGRTEEATAALEALLRLAPDLSAAQLRVFLPPVIVERYVEGLRKAGWKE
jgi:tetratricopeptide (TPR) repeat protein